MISFTVDSFATVQKILRNVDMIMFAESLGGTETLITYPTTQTHEDTPKDVKEKLGITDRFLRMSVGIENVEDFIADLDRALISYKKWIVTVRRWQSLNLFLKKQKGELDL